jgi:hypothetical protein
MALYYKTPLKENHAFALSKKFSEEYEELLAYYEYPSIAVIMKGKHYKK